MKKFKQHPFNTVCPYYTMFPIDFPKRVLSRSTKNKSVLDPFCGRGTTLFAAQEKGIRSIGIDSSIVATTISKAKVSYATPEDVLKEYDLLLESFDGSYDVPKGEFWEKAYHPQTLDLLSKLRSSLLLKADNDARNILKAVVLGALHGPLNKGSTPSSYFSNQMMRTFAAKPRYASKYWNERNMNAPFSDVRAVIKKRLQRLIIELPQKLNGSCVLHGDSRSSSTYRFINKNVDYVVTSPPYYGMRTYEEDQWIRLWFLGGPEAPVYKNSRQLTHSSAEAFAKDLSLVWNRVAEVANDNLLMVVRFGSIGSKKVDHKQIMKESLNFSNVHWKLTKSIDAGKSSDGRRQSLTMGANSASSSISENDFYVRFG